MSSPAPLQRLWRSAGSLKLRLALVGMLLVGLSVAVTTWWVLDDVGHHSEQIALDGQHEQVRRMARTMSGQLINLQLALRNVGDTLPVEAVDDARAMRDFLRGYPAFNTLFSSSFVARPDGRVVALHDTRPGHRTVDNVADRAYFQLTMRQRRPIVSDVLISRTSNEPAIVLTYPVLDAHGRITAVLGGAIDLSSRGLMREVTESDEDDTAITVVTDVQGRILSHPDRSWLMRDVGDVPRLREAVATWVGQGRPVEPAGDAVRAGEQIVAMAGVPDAEWVVFRSTPAAVVLRGQSEGRARAIQVGAFVALAGGAVLLGATFVMLAPLRRLERRARRLLDEHLADDEGWPNAAGELGRLSAVFQRVMRERSLAEATRHEVLERMQAIMAHSPVGIAFTREQRFELVSAQFNRLLGYPSPGLDGEATRLIYASDAFYSELGGRVGKAFAERRPFDEEIEFVRRDGTRFWGRLQGMPVRVDDASGGTIWSLDDVTQARREREALSWTSTHDPLTELVNRREFERLLGEQLGSRRRGPACALFIDLDHFKQVNDTAGHAAGDRVLIDVARLLTEQVRHADTVARLGGDEFAVLLHACARDSAAAVAEKMRAAVERYRLNANGHRLSVGASIGVVELDAALSSTEAVMAAADAACYEAKRAGRNTIKLHGASPLRLVTPA